MAKARSIIKRRKAIQNIRKITRTMELIATAQFKKAMDRAVQAEVFTRKIAEIVAELAQSAEGEVSHPLFRQESPPRRALMLVLTSNRGLAGGYNGNVLRTAYQRYQDQKTEGIPVSLEISGKRGIAFLRFRGMTPDASYTQFDDKPEFTAVEALAEKYIRLYVRGEIDQLDVTYTRFISSSRQIPVVETLLPMAQSLLSETQTPSRGAAASGKIAPRPSGSVEYEFLPDARTILEQLVPVSFKVRLFKCFLDAGVSEQISRMVAMRSATESADEMITALTQLYNRARQSQITRELAEIIGGAAALE